MRLTLDEVLAATDGTLAAPRARPPAPIIVTGVSTDTRTLSPGDLFVALRGPHADGHDFVMEALGRGAVAAVVTRPLRTAPATAAVILVDDALRALARLAQFYRQTLRLTVVGVTGSVGKTTVTRMCAAVLGTRFGVARTREEWNAEIGVPLTLLGLRPDTEVAVIEMAMRGLGQIAELVALARPRIGVVTNVGVAHLALLGTLENVARAKGELIVGLPPDGTAVLNADDPLVAPMAASAPCPVLTFGLANRADVRAGPTVAPDAEGMTFEIRSPQGMIEARLRTWGRHNISNALAAAAVGLAMGLSLEQIRAGLRAFRAPKMRLEIEHLGDVTVVNDAYNASPPSMRAALDVLAQIAGSRRRVAVLGEMRELGEQSAQWHREVGQWAGRAADVVVVVGEGARALGEGAAAAGVPAGSLHQTATAEEAVAVLGAVLRSGDVVLIKGSRALAMEHIVARLHEARPA